MTHYVALLRGINVGGHVVKMDRLRALFAEAGLSGVQTFIASGNVLFSAATRSVPALERKIERHLHAALGYEVPTFLRNADELNTVAAYQPFPLANGGTLYIGFLPRPPGAAEARKVLALGSPSEAIHVHGRELYFLVTGLVSESAMFRAPIDRILGLPITVRNANTVRKLAAKMPVSR